MNIALVDAQQLTGRCVRGRVGELQNVCRHGFAREVEPTKRRKLGLGGLAPIATFCRTPTGRSSPAYDEWSCSNGAECTP